MNQIEQRIRNVLASVFSIDVENIPDNCSYGSFEQWDSLSQMNLVVALEEEFGIHFSFEESSDMLNLAKIYNIVNSKTCD